MGDNNNDTLSRDARLKGLAAREDMILYIPNSESLGEGFVRLVDSMGDDLTVVNAARVSFNRKSKSMSEKDKSLIKYLIEHEHTSPLRHGFFTFHVKAPIFVMRQWGKHQVGCSWNEVSLRYVKHDMGFWEPRSWRSPPESHIKQGSGAPIEHQGHAHNIYDKAVNAAYKAYLDLINAGVCNEQARAILPMSMMTEFWWTASLQATLRFLDLRLAKDSQSEIRDYAEAVYKIVAEKYPSTLSAWEQHAR